MDEGLTVGANVRPISTSPEGGGDPYPRDGDAIPESDEITSPGFAAAWAAFLCLMMHTMVKTTNMTDPTMMPTMLNELVVVALLEDTLLEELRLLPLEELLLLLELVDPVLVVEVLPVLVSEDETEAYGSSEESY